MHPLPFCVAAATPFTPKPKACNAMTWHDMHASGVNWTLLDLFVSSSKALQLTSNGMVSHPWALSLFFRTPPLASAVRLWSQLSRDSAPLLQKAFVDCHDVYVSIPSCICCHLLKPLDQMFHVPVASLSIVIPILVCEVQKVHHQMLQDWGVSPVLTCQRIVQLGRQVVHDHWHSNRPARRTCTASWDIWVILWSFFFCWFSMHWLIILRIVCVVTCCTSMELLSDSTKVVVGTHSVPCNQVGSFCCVEPSPLFCSQVCGPCEAT